MIRVSPVVHVDETAQRFGPVASRGTQWHVSMDGISPRWIVRPARQKDLPGLAELMAESPLLRRYGLCLESALASLESALTENDLLLVGRAESGGEAAGLVWVIHTRALDGGAYVRLLLVKENLHGFGLGGLLLESAEAAARMWANHMYLLVTADNSPARRFYERRGYRHVGDLPGLVLPDLDEALYHKSLRSHHDR